MTDRELLELAAKAAGLDVAGWNTGSEPYSSGLGLILKNNELWNPLVYDGDAFRLFIKLDMAVTRPFDDNIIRVWHSDEGTDPITEHPGDDPFAATRRAIVRAAAEIGRESK